MLIIKEKANLLLQFSGMDSLDKCMNKNHFLTYNKNVSYDYNSRGFRDHEWPDDLSNVIWCVGDSFTVGLGQPFEETWPQILQNNIGKRCLNLGEDGCSNDTIALRVEEISKLYQPKLIIIMWSYLHRRKIDAADVQYSKADFGYKKDIKNFFKNYYKVFAQQTNTIHTIIPNALTGGVYTNFFNYFFKKKFFSNSFFLFDQLDYARDYQHFDIKTSKHVCDLICQKIKNFDKIHLS